MAALVPIKYRAFLSYSHSDAGWARWLHRALEGFRLDKDLVGRETPLGLVPKTLRPIFRDREDFSGGHSLSEATIVALDASAALIVLCSPVSASRPAVNEEARLFRARHPERPVIPVVIDGVPPENFPPALRYELAADGTMTDRPITILGPDLRGSGDGKSLGLAKIVAGLLGVRTDDVFSRAERARKRRNRFWGALAGVFFVLAVVASGSAFYAWQQLKTNEAFLTATLKRATEIVDEAVAQAQKFRVPRTATIALLIKAEGLFDDIARYGRPTSELGYVKGWMLIEFARNYAILGDTDKQFARASEACQLLSMVAADKSDDPKYQGALAAGYEELGDVLSVRGDRSEALKRFRESLAIYRRLAEVDPINMRLHVSRTLHKIGNELTIEEKFSEALVLFREALELSQQAVSAEPHNSGSQRNLAVAHNKVGDVLLDQEKITEAMNSFRAGLAIRERLVELDGNNSDWQRDLALSHQHVGEALMRQDRSVESVRSFMTSLVIVEQLIKKDPSNAIWQRDLGIVYTKMGNAIIGQHNYSAALKSYRAALPIFERLTKADPNNADLRRDLQIIIDKIGGIAYLFLMVKDAAAALDASTQAVSLSPGQISLYVNHAHALMLSGRIEEARMLYLRYRDEKRVQDEESWQSIILKDFYGLRISGMTHPLMDEIEEQFTSDD